MKDSGAIIPGAVTALVCDYEEYEALPTSHFRGVVRQPRGVM